MPLVRYGLIVVMMAAPLWAKSVLLRPPANSATVKVGSQTYLKGEVFLSNHQDTLALKSFGFRRLEFVGRSLGSVKYTALWPVTLAVDSLPDVVSGLNYELLEEVKAPEPVLLKLTPELQQVLEEKIEHGEAADAKRPYRRVIISDLEKGGVVEYYYKYMPATKKRPQVYDKEKVDNATKGTFHVTPIEEGPFHKKETLYQKDDPNLGFIHVNPVEEGRYHTKENVVVPDDPNLGTYHVNPVEAGRYHTKENVTTKDHPAVGTFHTRPDPNASSLRPTDFGILRNYSTFQTGQTFFTTPSGTNQPRTISWQEWQRTHRGR